MPTVEYINDTDLETLKNALRTACETCANAAEHAAQPHVRAVFSHAAGLYADLLVRLESADSVEVRECQ